MTYPAAVTLVYNAIMRSNVFKTDGPLIDLPRALTLLGRALHKRELPEGIWESLGEFSEACLGDLIIGAYWACSEWHGGQSSDTYAALCSLGEVFSPGMSDTPDPEESEFTAYELICEWFNKSQK
ncbi:hypothetical protein UFOVP431_38 [uncultured Caudovirales phage]|uniref:Uncharacterized protein n=1 Tax=uncultured Caudovirales phage TaxID=2100421 RepID=A0A6J5MNI1_9CAUD|nr:hypothetical protein UFOVP431_38 [uncultured Caudovirales phage]